MKPDFQIKNVKLYNCDCMDFMKEIPDNYFDLSICDPPYGINASNMEMGKGKNKLYTKNKWDNSIPSKEYFHELFRISKNQIIWGGNYFNLPLIEGWIVWDKLRYKDVSFADGELAWTSFKQKLKIARIKYDGFLGADIVRIHITQKPVALYKWILAHYAKKGDKIFDSHGGSFSSACACLDMGFEFDGCEIDKEYFDNDVERLKNNVQEYFDFTKSG